MCKRDQVKGVRFDRMIPIVEPVPQREHFVAYGLATVRKEA